MSAAIGCVEGSWSCRYAQALRWLRKLVHDVAVAGGLDRRVVGGPLGEGLVEPEVVPPAHGHEVAEPHVRQLVQDRVGALLVRGVGDAAAEHVVLEERDAPGVLHRAGVELRHEELVVLRERVGGREGLLEEREPLLGDGQDLVGVEVLGQRCAAEDAHRVGAVRPHVLVADGVVRTRDQRGDVRRDPRRRGERPARGAVAHGLGLRRGRVGHDLPRGRRGDGELELRTSGPAGRSRRTSVGRRRPRTASRGRRRRRRGRRTGAAPHRCACRRSRHRRPARCPRRARRGAVAPRRTPRRPGAGR